MKTRLALLLLTLLAADKPLPNPKPLPSTTPLPNALTFTDGRPVSAADWPARRSELLDLFQQIEYGRLPPPPTSTSIAPLINHTQKPTGTPHQQFKVTLAYKDSPEKLTFTLDLLTPKTGAGLFPVILTGDWCWHKIPDDIADTILSRGYAIAEFNRTEFAPDSPDQAHTGLHPLFPTADFGCVAAWAYGYSRAIDALTTLPQIDKEKIAITGHSRGGKATLLAGALDPRVALTNPNGSGCGGSGCFRDTPADAETLKVITTKFPFWFKSDFQQKFAGREKDLPLDQHELKACVAPRALLDTAGYNDVWSNPRGTYRTTQAARPVFELLNVPTHLAFHLRPGPHEHNLIDYTALLDYADEIFFNKKSPTNWNPAPLP